MHALLRRPLSGLDVGPLALATAFPARRTLDGLRRIDAAWHARAAHAAAAFERLRSDVVLRRAGPDAVEAGSAPFSHLTGETLQVCDVTVRPLLSFDDYVEEGLALGHCVGTHGSMGLQATMVAFSLEGRDGSRSTLAYDVPLDDAGTFAIREHRGPRNEAPGPVHVEAARRLSGILPFASAAPHLAAERRSRGAWGGSASVVRFDLMDDGERRAMAEMQFADVSLWLPQSEVALGAAQWLDRSAPVADGVGSVTVRFG